ncbi:MAG: hypothetical protein JNL82_25010 [Myxococcales bacterium]|nr:hypothetical protein [Myxococcales bacterium]
MSAEHVLYQSPLMYRVLREAGGSVALEVVVGGVAMYTVRVRLDDAELAAYEREGSSFSDRLAREIMARPDFGGRAYEV